MLRLRSQIHGQALSMSPINGPAKGPVALVVRCGENQHPNPARFPKRSTIAFPCSPDLLYWV